MTPYLEEHLAVCLAVFRKERVHGWAELLNLARYVTGQRAREEGRRGAGAGLLVSGPCWAQTPAPGTQETGQQHLH